MTPAIGRINSAILHNHAGAVYDLIPHPSKLQVLRQARKTADALGIHQAHVRHCMAPQHGLSSYVNLGCRCKVCSAANRNYHKRRALWVQVLCLALRLEEAAKPTESARRRG